MRAFLPWLLILALAPVPVLADGTRIQVIELQGRPAQEMIPLIQPLLDPGETVTGTGYQLILRASPATLDRLEAVVQRLDQPPRRLRITVHRGELDLREQDRLEAQLERSGSEAQVRAGKSGADGGLVVEQRDERGSASVRTESTRRLRDAGQHHQVQALEGHPAHIATGIAFPYVSQIEHRGPYGSTSGIEYREAASGFYVLARLRGDGQVQLDISPYREALSPRGGGMVETSRLVTRVSGPVGSWLQLGGVGETVGQDSEGYVRSRRTRDRQEEHVWFRVDVLD